MYKYVAFTFLYYYTFEILSTDSKLTHRTASLTGIAYTVLFCFNNAELSFYVVIHVITSLSTFKKHLENSPF